MKRREEKKTQEFIVVRHPSLRPLLKQTLLEPFSLLNSFTLARVEANYKLNPKLPEIFFPSKRFQKHLLITGISNLSRSLFYKKNSSQKNYNLKSYNQI